jgi:hypothetical protein
MISTFLNSFIAILSLSTAVGVLVHDTHIDTVTTTALAASTSNDPGKVLPSPDPHTHPERHSLSRLLGSRTPGVQPRLNEDKKHLLQKYAVRGHHPFDNYNLPIV